MNIAFCISGQFRDEALSFPAASRLAQQLNAVVFVSTWRKRGTKTTGVILEAQADRMFGKEFTKVFPRALFNLGISHVFPDLEREIAGKFSDVEPEHIHRYFPEATVDIEAEILPLTFEEKVHDNNSLKMLYKIWRCNELKRAHEKRHARRFDLVVRFRPDIVPSITLQQCRDMLNSDIEKQLWAPHDNNPIFVNDVLAISSSCVADYYASLFGKAVQSPSRPWRLVHQELASHLADAGIEVRDTPTAQWLMEDFATRQRLNRYVMRKLIAVGKVGNAAFADQHAWRKVLWILQDLEAILDGAGVGILDSDHLFRSNAEILKSFPKELFSLTGLMFDRLQDVPSAFLAKFLALVVDLKEEGSRRLQSDDFLDMALAVFKSGLTMGFKAPFHPDSLVKALSSDDIHHCVRQLATDYIAHCTDHGLRDAVDLLQTLGDRATFLLAALDHALDRSRDLSEAEIIARRMVEQFPQDWRAFDKMSYVMSASQQPREALLFAQKALDLDPRNGGLMMRLGHLAREINDISLARDYFEQATLAWDHELPWRCLIDLLIREDRLPEARSLMTKACERFPGQFFQQFESAL